MSKLSTLTTLLFLTFSLAISGQSLEWIYLAPGATSVTCTSATDCDVENVCFGLAYTPAATGRVTSYTLGFLADCPNGSQPAVAASSCTMSDNTFVSPGCANDIFLLQASGNNGSLVIAAGTPVILHQVCIQVGTDRIRVIEDEITGLTVSVDQTVGGPTTEVLSFDPFLADATDCGVVFPVSWTHFAAQKAGKAAALNWGTSLEENHDYFSVEHSTDGNAFTSLGQVRAPQTELNGERRYAFVHETPAAGANFYRIRQVDVDGTTSFSVIRTLTFSGGAATDFSVYPNPVEGELTLEFSAEVSSTEVEILTADGRLVMSRSSPQGATKMRINAQDLPTGVYVVRVNDVARRFVKR